MERRHICHNLVNVIRIYHRDLIIASESFVFGIQHYIIFIKVRVTNTTMSFKQIDSPLVTFVLWMNKTLFAQNRIDILLPKPCSIKKDAADLFVTFTILHFFHP